MSQTPVNIFAIGASMNIGYYAALKFLEKGATITYLLRKPTVFDDDQVMKPYFTSGHAHIVKGDALKQEEVAQGWQKALEVGNGKVDLVLFTVGGRPDFKVTKGLVLDVPDLTTRCLRNVLLSMPASTSELASPKFIVISSIGLNKESHDRLPLPMRLMYGCLLTSPLADKIGLERVAFHVGGMEWRDPEPEAKILPVGWEEGLPEGGVDIAIVRPAFLTDGKETGKYRVSENMLDKAGTVSRKNTAHFIAVGLWPDWSKYSRKAVAVGN